MATQDFAVTVVFNAIMNALAEQRMKPSDVREQIVNLRQLMSWTDDIKYHSDQFTEEASGVWNTVHGFPVYWWSVDDCHVIDLLSIRFSLSPNRPDNDVPNIYLQYIEGDVALFYKGQRILVWNELGDKEFEEELGGNGDLCGVCYHYDVDPMTGICVCGTDSKTGLLAKS